MALIGDLVPVKERQVAIGRLLLAILTGNLLGASIAGVIGDVFGWRGVFFALGGFGTLALALAFLGVPGLHGERGPLRAHRNGPGFPRHLRATLAPRSALARCFWRRSSSTAVSLRRDLLRPAGEARASIAGMVIAGFGVGGAIYGLTLSRLLALLRETRMMLVGGAVIGLWLVVMQPHSLRRSKS